jgi:hypothetical protein
MSNGKVTLENSVALSYRTKYTVTIKPSLYTPGYLSQRNGDVFMQKSEHEMNISFTHNRKILETIQMLLNR